MFVLGDGLRLECVVVEIAGQDEGTILRYIIPGEPEEGLLGLEIADLQGAVGFGTEAGATAGERQFRFGQGQIVQPLTVIEIRQAVQGVLLGFREDGQ